MARGFKTGGRKPGSKNKLTLAKLRMREEALAALSKDNPHLFEGDALELLQLAYKNPKLDLEARVDAAFKAAPFERPKKSETTVSDQREYVVYMPRPVKDMEEWREIYGSCMGASDPESEERIKEIGESPAKAAEEDDEPSKPEEIN